MKEKITSIHNPRIRNLIILLSKSKERKRQNCFIIEGYREICRAVSSGYQLREVYYCQDLDRKKELNKILNVIPEVALCMVSLSVFEKIAYRGGSDGFLAIAESRLLELEKLQLGKNPLILILESVEKPGNLGAVLRTADAAGLDAVVICDPLTDIYNPNIIRSSLGCIFTVQVAVSGSDEVMHWMKSINITAYASVLSSCDSYFDKDYRQGTAFIMGTESEGLSDRWLKYTTEHIKIPMYGLADSLNVSVSAGILVYEAIRQRR